MGDYSIPVEKAKDVSQPTIVLAGESSFPFFLQTVAVLGDAIPEGESKTLPGQEHNVAPEVIGPVLAEFFYPLTRVSSLARSAPRAAQPPGAHPCPRCAPQRRNAAATPASTGMCSPVVWERSPPTSANTAPATCSGRTSFFSSVRWA